MMLITIAGEDDKFREQLADLLENQKYRVDQIPKPGRALEALRRAPPDLLVVLKPFYNDALAPFLRTIREDAVLRRIPVVCVNPKASSLEGVACLDAGADDFISRPFNPLIFLARVRTLLRRRLWSGAVAESSQSRMKYGALEVRLVSRTVALAGKPATLTRLEFDLLAELMTNPEKVFSRQNLLEAVWNYPGNVETRTLDKHVETLRRKLGSCGALIETVHGVGYRFVAACGRAGGKKK